MNQVATIQPEQPLTIVNDGASLMSAIARAAADPSVDVEKMERLMAMHRDMQKQQAEAEFNDAMTRVQTNMRRVGADKRNSQTNSDYATYAKLDRYLRPLYTAEGFALSFGTEESPIVEMVRVVCHVSHRGGFTRKYLIDMPADGKGAKGNDVMTKTHATGSATQYGMRYLLKMIFNVAIGQDPDDDDGNNADGEIDSSWFDGVESAADQHGLKALKAEMVQKFGSTQKIPKALIRAYNDKWAALGK
jgi:hypothetical protein